MSFIMLKQTLRGLVWLLMLCFSLTNYAQVVINEIHADPALGTVGDANNDGSRSSSADEFVELYNIGNSAVDISGWRLRDNANGNRHTFPEGTILAAKKAIVVFGGGNPTGSFGGAVVQTATSGALGLNNGGDQVSLLNRSGATITLYNYSGTEGGDNQSITRSPDGVGSFQKHIAISGFRYTPGANTAGEAFGDNTGGGGGNNDPLHVVTWNIELFGNTSSGPSPESTQKERAKAIIQALDADVYALQEIANENLMNELVNELPEYSWVYSTLVSGGSNSPGFSTKLAFVYKTSRVKFISAQALLTNLHPYYNGGDQSLVADFPTGNPNRFWASGRMPYMLTADVTIGKTTERVYFVNVHAKARSGATNRSRRRYDVQRLKEYLDSNLGNVNLILLGDYNDQLDYSNSPYNIYFNDNASNPGPDGEYYSMLTRQLDIDGENTFVGSSVFLDHIAITDELVDNYITGSIKVHNEVVTADFTRRTSDHIPVSAKFRFDNTSVNRINTSVPSFAPDWVIYPNPAPTKLIQVKVPQLESSTTARVQVYNALGQVVTQASATPGTTMPIKLGNTAGTYYVVIRTADGRQYTKKVILE